MLEIEFSVPQNDIKERKTKMSKILIVVDMQNDFITGSLGTKEAEAIVERVVEKIEIYKQQGHKVIYTRDTHDETYLSTKEGEKLPVIHCVKGTLGWQLATAIQKTVISANQIYDKRTFGAVTLGEKIKCLSEEEADLEVELVGLCTDICVISNALLIKAYAPEVAITVDAACCAGVTPESHEIALSAMKMCQISILNA